MTRDELLEKLRALKPWLAEQGVEGVRLYGSFARDEANPHSDVDLIVEITRPLGFRFFGVERELGERLGRPVEMTTETAMHRLVRRKAVSEAIRV